MDNVICPSCGRELGNSLFRHDWCPADRAYFCTACTREKARCPACKSRPADVQLGLAGLVILVILISSSVAILPQHISRTMDIQTPTADIRNASVGQDVRIFGTIDAPQKSAFTIMFRDGYWQLQQDTDFVIIDSKKDIIRPVLTSCHDFQISTHNISVKDRSDYWDGDKVTVFGRVGQKDDGNKTLEVRRIYPGATDPYELLPGWYQTLWLLPAILIFLLIQVLVFYGYRRRLHARFLREHPVDIRKVFDAQVAEKDIAWHQSAFLQDERRKSTILGLMSLILALLVLAPTALQPWLWEVYPVPLVSGSIFAVYAVVFTFLYWEMTHSTPVALGFSKHALHIRYRPKKKAPEQTVSIPWSELVRYTSSTEFGRSYMRFFTEGRTEYAIVPKAIRKLFDAEYASRKKGSSGQ